MKILKKGNHKPTEYLFKCVLCGCVFVEDETSSGTSYDLKNRKFYLSCDCPYCGCSCKSDEIYTEEKE